MDLIPIGEAARRLGVRASTLRYYEERDLVQPAARVHGIRHYGLQEMRRLALLQMAQRLGIRLDTAAAVLDAAREQWHATMSEQIAAEHTDERSTRDSSKPGESHSESVRQDVARRRIR